MRAIGLRFLDGPRRGVEISFSGARVRVGRSRDSDLVLPDEESPASSAHHAELERAGRHWRIRDLGSMNGTWVNGARVESARLGNGDRIGFGGPPLVECRLSTSRGALWAGVAAALLLVLGSAAGFLLRGGDGFEGAAARAARAVYLVAVEDGDRRVAVGTAFSVASEGVLATNAHVAEELRRRVAASPGSRALALLSDSSEERPLASARFHPDYRPGELSGDVALLMLAPGPPLEPLGLADDAALARLHRGMRVGAFGFPAPATDPDRPRGRLSEDVLGDVRGRFLEVGLRVAPGMSGSPIFTRDGLVVGLVVGGDFVPTGPGPPSVSSGVNWGLSVAPLRALLGGRGEVVALN